jgi:hypothetical protein
MLKGLKTLVGLIVAVSMFSTFFSFAFLIPVNTTSTQFELAKIIPNLSTEHTQYALTANNTLLKRVVFANVVSDFIVKFINNIPVFIPLKGSSVQAKKYQNFKFTAWLGFGSLNQTSSLFWVFLAFTTIILLFVSTNKSQLNRKQRSLLSAIARARAYAASTQFNFFKTKALVGV